MKKFLVIFVTLFTIMLGVNQVSAFSDVTSFEKEIKKLTDLGIINGYDDGTFRPNNKITRVQTVQMITRELKVTTSGKKPGFTDVKKGSNGYNEIAIAVEKGFISGFNDGTFRPSEKLTRAQMAKILVLAYDLKGSTSGSFKDVKKGSWSEQYIDILASSGITFGYGDGTYRPDHFVTRSQFSAFLSRVIDLKEVEKPSEPIEEPNPPIEEPTSPIEEPIEEPGNPIEPPAGSGITYKGITDVKSNVFAPNETIQNVHHYIADMGEGNPIHMYVTEDYEKRFGKGFSYDETVSIINSIDAKRKAKPYTQKLGTLDIFFYTNESNTPLPTNDQAVIGSRSMNTGDGKPSEMIINGSNMTYDFRTSYVHEFIHYFDYQSFVTENEQAYRNYWGESYRFWLLEGGAEYGSYFFYDYPENTKNNLWKSFVQPNRESIINYAKNQGGYKQNLLYDLELNSFDDINAASSNNYGITLSLFWYLVEQYGYEEVYEYVRYVGETFNNTSGITQSQKDQTAIKFLGKTEEQVLKEWLTYFNHFDGGLQEYKETETATANYILKQDGNLTSSEFNQHIGMQQDGSYKFAVNISEWIPGMGYTQGESFRAKATFSFTLVAEGYESVDINRNYYLYTGTLTNNEQLYAFGFDIPASAQAKLVKGVSYKIVPNHNDLIYKWVIPNDVLFTW